MPNIDISPNNTLLAILPQCCTDLGVHNATAMEPIIEIQCWDNVATLIQKVVPMLVPSAETQQNYNLVSILPQYCTSVSGNIEI